MPDDEITAGGAFLRHLGTAAVIVDEGTAVFVLTLPEVASGLLLKALQRAAAERAFRSGFGIKERNRPGFLVLKGLSTLSVLTFPEIAVLTADTAQRASAFLAFKLRSALLSSGNQLPDHLIPGDGIAAGVDDFLHPAADADFKGGVITVKAHDVVKALFPDGRHAR